MQAREQSEHCAWMCLIVHTVECADDGRFKLAQSHCCIRSGSHTQMAIYTLFASVTAVTQIFRAPTQRLYCIVCILFNAKGHMPHGKIDQWRWKASAKTRMQTAERDKPMN